LRLPAKEQTEVKAESNRKKHTEIDSKAKHVYSLRISYFFHADTCVLAFEHTSLKHLFVALFIKPPKLAILPAT